MRIVAVQADTVWQDKSASHARVARLLDREQIEAGSLIVLAETFDTGFGGDIATIAEDERGPSWQFLAELARGHRSFVLGGITQHAPQSGKGLNVALVFDPSGAEVARYVKIHPFTFSGEAEYIQPGENVVDFDWSGVRVAPLICYDLRFPEVFRHAVLGGAEVLPVIANWPSARAHHWTMLLQARAIENQAYVVGVNRCGSDPNLAYPGLSMVVDPRGEVLAQAGDDEAVLNVEVDVAALRDYRATHPFLADIRSNLLGRD